MLQCRPKQYSAARQPPVDNQQAGITVHMEAHTRGAARAHTGACRRAPLRSVRPSSDPFACSTRHSNRVSAALTDPHGAGSMQMASIPRQKCRWPKRWPRRVRTGTGQQVRCTPGSPSCLKKAPARPARTDRCRCPPDRCAPALALPYIQQKHISVNVSTLRSQASPSDQHALVILWPCSEATTVVHAALGRPASHRLVPGRHASNA